MDCLFCSYGSNEWKAPCYICKLDSCPYEAEKPASITTLYGEIIKFDYRKIEEADSQPINYKAIEEFKRKVKEN